MKTNMKTCNKSITSKCLTFDGKPRDQSLFPYQRKECNECFKQRQSDYYAKSKSNKISALKASSTDTNSIIIESNNLLMKMMNAVVELYQSRPKIINQKFELSI